MTVTTLYCWWQSYTNVNSLIEWDNASKVLNIQQCSCAKADAIGTATIRQIYNLIVGLEMKTWSEYYADADSSES